MKNFFILKKKNNDHFNITNVFDRDSFYHLAFSKKKCRKRLQ